MFDRQKKPELRDTLLECAAGAGIGVALIGALAGYSFVSGRKEHLDNERNVSTERGQETRLDVHEFREIAKEAYVWGWPLVYVHQIRSALERVPFPAVIGGVPVAPINKLSMLADLITPGAAPIVCANQDVIYGFGMLDLARDPVVIQVPDFGERFWLYQLGDHRTDSFAEVGCMYGTKPGFYLVVGPNWDEPIPVGISGVFRCPTRYGYCLPRVHFENSESDRAAALPAVNRIMAYPLRQFSGTMQSRDWSRPRWIPNLGNRGSKTRTVSPETFFDSFAEILNDVPPLPGEEALYGRFKRLVEEVQRDPRLEAELTKAAFEADRAIVSPFFEFRNIGQHLPGNWTTVCNGGDFGLDYTTRTAVAKSNVFVNRHKETKYYYLDLDEDGGRLNGKGEYEITFPPSALPPAKGFWSITVYDEKHVLPADTKGRLSLGSRDRSLVFNPDGSLSITMGSRPSHSNQRNRLSTPEGNFSLYLRIYWPEESALDGSWTPPPAQKKCQ